jgi:hypothetical protein
VTTRPPITLLGPTQEQPDPVAHFTADPVVRVAITSDDPTPTTIEGWNELATQHGWPGLMESVTRRGIQPRGTWTMLLDTAEDWRRHISPEVQHAIDTGCREHPGRRVVCVALLVDSATIQAQSEPHRNGR